MTSWFDRDELLALFKGVRPRKGVLAPDLREEQVPSPEPDLAHEPTTSPPDETPEAAAEAPPALSAASEPEPEPARETGEAAARSAEASAPAVEAPSVPSPIAEPPPVGAEPPVVGAEPTAIAAEPSPVVIEPPPVAAPPSPPPPDSPSADAPPRAIPEPPPSAPHHPASTVPRSQTPAPPTGTGDPVAEALWRQAEALLHLARGQAAAQALEERLWEITETAASVLSLGRASVWTFENEERTRLACADFYSAIRDAHESGQIQAARDYPLYFAALHSERAIVANDAKADPRTRELTGGSVTPSQSRIEAPVFVAGRLAGVVRLEHEGSPRRFEHHEEAFASSLADLAGLALEAQERRLREAVARVGEERVRAQRDALAELSRSEAFARGRIEGVLHEVTEAAARVLRAERTSVWVYAPDYKSLFCLDLFERSTSRHLRGTELAEAQAPVYFEALKGGGRLATADAREDERLQELVRDGIVPPGISARLEAPVHLVGRLAGLVWCERAGAPRTWLTDEERFVEALAGFVALSFATSERRRTENELSRALEDVDRSPKGSPAEPSAPASPPRAPDAFEDDLGDA